MSRTRVDPQGGRGGKSGVKKEDEWGTTSSQAEFRGYEAAEMRNARAAPAHVKTCMQPSSGGTQPKVKGTTLHTWNRQQESFPDHSAYTATEQSNARQGKDNKPAWSKTHNNPMPQHTFDATSSYNQHQAQAQEARHGHFPYRDEFAPRSKRLLYELAHQRFSRDSVASGSTDSASAFTMSSRPSVARSGAGRSNSETSLASSHHTCDTNRVIGGVARRRRDATFRSPSLCAWDQEWLQEKLKNEGPQGITFANFKPSFYHRSCQQEVEQTLAIRDLLVNGRLDAEVRESTSLAERRRKG